MLENNDRELLKRWSVEAKVPATFNAAVWRRIEQHKPVSVFGEVARWLTTLLAKPAAGVSYTGMALIIGLAAGHLHASNKVQQRENELQARYIQSVDPYATRTLK